MDITQRQTVVGQFYQLDRLVVEGGISVCTHLYSLYFGTTCSLIFRVNSQERPATLSGKRNNTTIRAGRLIMFLRDLE